jgi:TrmH family RNA methyltransferase
VPIYGRAESLNLAAAAAVCLYASAARLYPRGSA